MMSAVLNAQQHSSMSDASLRLEFSRKLQLAAALEDGMLTRKMDRIEKVPSGLTDIRQARQICIK